jgi:hypothetical protein
MSRSPLNFDLSVFDIFNALAAGARLIIHDLRAHAGEASAVRHKAYVDDLRRHGATILYTTPSTFTTLLDKGGLDANVSLRLMLYAGEPFRPPLLRALMLALPQAKVANIYGPTETNIVTCYWLPGPPEGIDPARAAARQSLLSPLQARAADDAVLTDYAEVQREALRLAGPGFMRHFKLAEEPGSVRQRYGGEFGQRCLLARRLVQSGVRFIEVSHNLNFLNGTGWDVHNEGIRNQHLLIRELDTALSALLIDLEQRGLLDSTLVVVATEFGRPPEFDGRGGRGHQGSAFTMVLAGGGLRHRGVYGVTDDSGKKIIEGAVSIPDFHATILAAMGVDPALELMDGTRPVPVTDGGKPLYVLMG